MDETSVVVRPQPGNEALREAKLEALRRAQRIDSLPRDELAR